MASEAYLTLQNITSGIENHLNQYLKEAGYKESYDQETVEEMKQRYPNAAIVKDPINNPETKGAQYIFVLPSTFRDNNLTAKRIENTRTMLLEVQKVLSTLSENITKDTMEAKLSMLQEHLRSAMARNNNVSKDHNKYHCSRRQSATMNLGFFSTWWNTSWRKSRATNAFEKSLDLLKGHVQADTSKIVHKSRK